MRVISVDQSFTACAWVISDYDEMDESWEIIDFGVITSDKGVCVYRRAEDIGKALVQAINEYEPQKLIIEGLAYGAFGGNAAKNLSGLLFVICVMVKRGTHLGYTDMEYPSPTSLKKSHTGSGKASKKDMLNALPEDVHDLFASRYKLTKGRYDLADAYSMLKWYSDRELKD